MMNKDNKDKKTEDKAASVFLSLLSLFIIHHSEFIIS